MKRRHSLLQCPGSTSFITTTIAYFLSVLANEALAKIVLDSMRIYAHRYHVQIHGFVVMPNHLHLLVTGKAQELVSQFMDKLKEYSAKEIINWCLQHKENRWLMKFSTAATESKQGHRYQIWQKRFDNVVITRQEDLLVKLNYIHNNPLQERWGLCQKSQDYRFSSARYYFAGEDTDIPVVKIT